MREKKQILEWILAVKFLSFWSDEMTAGEMCWPQIVFVGEKTKTKKKKRKG